MSLTVASQLYLSKEDTMSTNAPADEVDGFEAFLNLLKTPSPPILLKDHAKDETADNNKANAAADDDDPAFVENLNEIRKNAELVTAMTSRGDSDDGSGLYLADTTATTERESTVDELIAQLDTDGSGQIIMSPEQLKIFVTKATMSKKVEIVKTDNDGTAQRKAEKFVSSLNETNIEGGVVHSPSLSATNEADRGGVKQTSSDSVQMKSDEANDNDKIHDGGFRDHDADIQKKPAAAVNDNVTQLKGDSMHKKSVVHVASNNKGNDAAALKELAKLDEGNAQTKMATNPTFYDREKAAATVNEHMSTTSPENLNNPFADLLALRAVSGLSPPVPVTITEFEFDDGNVQREIDFKEQPFLLLPQTGVLRTITEETTSHDTSTDNSEDEESPPINDGDYPIHNDGNEADVIFDTDNVNHASVSPSLQQQAQDDSTLMIPEDFLAIIDAYTKLLKKQRRTKLLLMLVLAVVTVLAISLRMSLSSGKRVTEVAVLTSSPPSFSITPTARPSTETCYWIEIAVVYDEYPYEISWDLQSIGMDGDVVAVKSHTAADGDASHTESICLSEGEYEFTINDSYGTCCFEGEGLYNVTSYGALIVHGGQFKEEEEKTRFSIPFVPL
mmetsp:Transcript_35006/g.64233  ORF Transcript_35006/g.64233 Transcript_35006/m.64233 type:complete len:617 (-) Transcript_35006:461-2311(-)